MVTQADVARGRHADRPRDIPRSGWFDIAARVKNELREDNLSLIAAGVGLFALLAAFPALAAMVAIYGIFASPSDVAGHLQQLGGIVPADALDIFRTQLTDLAQRGNQALGVGVAVSLLIALWSARKGMVAIMQSCNVAYDEEERRGPVVLALVSIGFTLFAIVYVLVMLSVGVALPFVFQAVFQNETIADTLSLLRWPLLWFLLVLALAVVYRYAPSRSRARWRWVTWGSAIAATLWVVGSIAFAIYVRNFAAYGETYGALGGVVVLLLWLYISAYVVLLGAEINAEIEHQTERDSTTGRERPMGSRGAYVADTVGAARGRG